jgi:hypothetical protein
MDLPAESGSLRLLWLFMSHRPVSAYILGHQKLVSLKYGLLCIFRVVSDYVLRFVGQRIIQAILNRQRLLFH